jgi:hypothetical protein
MAIILGSVLTWLVDRQVEPSLGCIVHYVGTLVWRFDNRYFVDTVAVEM